MRALIGRLLWWFLDSARPVVPADTHERGLDRARDIMLAHGVRRELLKDR